MKLNTAAECEQICYEFKLADYPRGLNRALVNDLANGVPPYTKDEVDRNNVPININFLGLTRLSHEARMQFSGTSSSLDGSSLAARTPVLSTSGQDVQPLSPRR